MGGHFPASVDEFDAQKKAIGIYNDLGKQFITFAITTVGALAYYIESRAEFRPMGTTVKVALLSSIVAAIVSIYFGQSWLSGLANQLANNYFKPSAPSVAVPELAQYVCFLLSLSWGAIAIVLQEINRETLTRACVDGGAIGDVESNSASSTFSQD